MRLLLHIGTEKTGSSYLQKLCAINREFLVSNGVYFAHAGKDEGRMLHGSISPGNGRQLALYIDRGDWEGATNWLTDHRHKAESQHCMSLLISNENIVKSLSSNGCMQKINSAARKSGFANMEMLLVIRDPVDQAVSLYKHRAKNGKLGGISEWLESGYTLPAEISGFLGQVENDEFDVKIRKYTSSSKGLITIFLHDWLQIVDDLPHRLVDLVNPSLTLAELQVLRFASRIHVDAAAVFYSNFLAIPKSLKASDKELEQVHRNATANYLLQYSAIWRKLDNVLQSEGGLSIPTAVKTDPVCNAKFNFSNDQLVAIDASYKEVRGIEFRLRRYMYRSIIRKLKLIIARLGNLGSVAS